MSARLKERYADEIRPQLLERFGYSSVMQVPRLEKITLNMGVGEAKQDTKMLEAAVEQMAAIAGQKPAVRRARKSIATFKLREGMPVGVMATLRGERMWEMLDRLQSIAIPRIRDFRGLNPRSFDGRGNYSMGVREQIIFPEIDYDAIDQVRGLNVTITTTAETDDEARELLRLLGMPFRREGDEGQTAAQMRQEQEAAARRAAEEEAREAARGGGAREARGGGRGRGRRRGERASPLRTAESRNPRNDRSKLGANGKDLTDRPPAARKQVQDPQLQSVSPVRQVARLLPQVRPLPDLPARDRPRGHDPRHDEVVLVTGVLKASAAGAKHRTLGRRSLDTMSDSVADCLTRIRNALGADHQDVVVPASRLNQELARVLRQEGYIEDFGIEQTTRPPGSRERKSTTQFNALRIRLKYTEARQPVISGLRCVSKAGRRQYASADELPRVQGGMGTAILTTSRGVMTAYQARDQRVGGEVLAYIW